MSLPIDLQYVPEISQFLERFTQKDKYLWNFRCPICGDSAKNKTKCRGYLYLNYEKTGLSFRCHNCGATRTFKYFLKEISQNVYSQYSREFLKKDKHREMPENQPRKEIFQHNLDIALPSIASLGVDHVARCYVESRCIPQKFFRKLFYAEDFANWISRYTDKYKDLKGDVRIVLPFLTKNGRLFGAQGRSVEHNPIKYISLKIDNDHPFVFGLDRWSRDKITFIVEGPIDSLFLPNCLASANSDLFRLFGLLDLNLDKTVFIYDNEPRNTQILKLMKKAIDGGGKVCIWPDNINEKDINEMILSGWSRKDVLGMFVDCCYQGMKAKLQFEKWRKNDC